MDIGLKTVMQKKDRDAPYIYKKAPYSRVRKRGLVGGGSPIN